MSAFAILIAAACISTVWSYAPPLYLRNPDSIIFAGQGSRTAHPNDLGIGLTVGCRLGSGGQRENNRRRLNLRGAATLQIKANTGHLPLDAASDVISKSTQAVEPVIICGPSGVGKVIFQQTPETHAVCKPPTRYTGSDYFLFPHARARSLPASRANSGMPSASAFRTPPAPHAQVRHTRAAHLPSHPHDPGDPSSRVRSALSRRHSLRSSHHMSFTLILSLHDPPPLLPASPPASFSFSCPPVLLPSMSSFSPCFSSAPLRAPLIIFHNLKNNLT
jgi:hypothetical protein